MRTNELERLKQELARNSKDTKSFESQYKVIIERLSRKPEREFVGFP